MTGGLRKMLGLFVGSKDTGKADAKSDQTEDKQVANESIKAQDLQLVTTREMMTRLAKTKEKVEKHVSNLLLSAFGEQLIYSQGKNNNFKTTFCHFYWHNAGQDLAVGYCL